MSSVSELEVKYKELVARNNKFINNRTKVQAVFDSRRSELKKVIEDCKEAGYNPDTLKEDIKTASEVLEIKLNAAEKELTVQEQLLAPMLKEINNS